MKYSGSSPVSVSSVLHLADYKCLASPSIWDWNALPRNEHPNITDFARHLELRLNADHAAKGLTIELGKSDGALHEDRTVSWCNLTTTYTKVQRQGSESSRKC